MRKIVSGIFALSMLAGMGAQAITHQVNASATGGTFDLGIGDLSAMGFGFTVAYRAGINEMIQIEVPVAFSWQDAEPDAVTSWAIGAGPVFNFAGDLQNSTFAGIVAKMSKSGEADSVISFDVSVGKRFEIVSNVSYEPALVASYTLGDAAEADRTDLEVRFLSLTATF